MWRARIVYYLYKLFFSSWRRALIVHPETQKLLDEKKPLVLAHWHGEELALIFLVEQLKLATMASQSSDGSIVSYVINRLGGVTSRGSSSRGAIGALIGLVRFCKSGRPTSIAVDGPRGPYHKVKPGVFELSKLCGAYVVPVGATSSSAIHFKKSWNKAFLPYPFAKVRVYFGEPIAPLTKDQDAKDVSLAHSLALKIDNASQQAAKLIATNHAGC